jgi:hypothetical protein
MKTLRFALAFAVFAVPASAFFIGCGSKASSVCSQICDCEHCNDYDEANTCSGLNTEASVAKDYGCTSQFTDYLQCILDKGTCDETAARYTTHQKGSCSASIDTHFPCKQTTDCLGNAGTCTGGTCHTTSCTGSGQPCQTDSDCISGKDLCADQVIAVQKCADAASNDPNLANIFGGTMANP